MLRRSKEPHSSEEASWRETNPQPRISFPYQFIELSRIIVSAARVPVQRYMGIVVTSLVHD